MAEELHEEVCELARMALALFGDLAAAVARERAEQLDQQGEIDAAFIWRNVEVEIARLQDMQPDASRH
jgi:hypothetical protein